MRWRERGSTPVGITQGKVYPVTVDLWNTSYIFNAGHSLRVAISSSNYPRFSVNPNTGAPLETTDSRNVTSVNTVHHSASHASSLILPIVSLSALPKHGVLESMENAIEALAPLSNAPKDVFESTLRAAATALEDSMSVRV